MLKVVGCFVDAHDHRLVVLAALICALASFTAVQLLCHARNLRSWSRLAWLAVAATAGGSGIWATHFIDMLAFAPGVPSGYDPVLTVLSLVLAIALTGCGLALGLQTRVSFAGWLGGAFVVGGIAVMHFTGMAAFVVAGRILWDPWTVIASIALGLGFGSLALPIALGGPSMLRRLVAAAVLFLAIGTLHFTAMGAVTILPDPTIQMTSSALPTGWVAGGVALASLAILLFAGAALAVDLRDRRQMAVQRERLHSLANAAVEGLVVCRGDRIVSANDSLARLVGTSAAALDGVSLSTLLPDDVMRQVLEGGLAQGLETTLKPSDGDLIPIELIVRSVEYGSEPHYARAIRDLRSRRQAESRIKFLALHDGLTGLANRTNFNARLDQEMKIASAKGEKLAVLCLDLDRFKQVNDLFGHAAGDKLLQDVARIVTGLLDETQLMSRLGGDEFAVLARVDHRAAAGRLAERILRKLQADSSVISGPTIATSIGIAVYPDDATDQATLLTYADTALYRAKGEGRGTYRFYEDRMGVAVRERRLLEFELRHAIARGQIYVAYQPQTEVDTGTIMGFEALLRWQHPERGLVPPSVFIPIAEDSGFILQLGEWVLRTSCREAASWQKPLSIAVNVSANQVQSPSFVATLQQVLFETGLSPHRLEIEITETALVRDPARALSTLRQVKALGVHIAMDDFGTGYSSLSNLRLFPFDKIKIDRSFVRLVDANQQTAAIVRSVLGLGRGLGLPVTAEGVETAEELEFLKGEGCNGAQGFLIGRPAPIEAFSEHIRSAVLAPGPAVAA